MRLPEEKRCVHKYSNGRRCGNQRWRGKEVCFQHDPEAAELRKKAGRPASALRIMTATEVHAELSRTLEELREKRITPGEAYARGYLAQLLLGNLKAMGEEYDWAKTQWERYQEMARRVRALDEGTYEEKEAEGAEGKVAEGKADPSTSLPSTALPSAPLGAGGTGRAGTDKQESPIGGDEDDSNERLP